MKGGCQTCYHLITSQICIQFDLKSWPKSLIKRFQNIITGNQWGGIDIHYSGQGGHALWKTGKTGKMVGKKIPAGKNQGI